jgi:hypothetical protein
MVQDRVSVESINKRKYRTHTVPLLLPVRVESELLPSPPFVVGGLAVGATVLSVSPGVGADDRPALSDPVESER